MMVWGHFPQQLQAHQSVKTCSESCLISRLLLQLLQEFLKASGVLLPGEAGILLIYSPDFFKVSRPAKDKCPKAI